MGEPAPATGEAAPGTSEAAARVGETASPPPALAAPPSAPPPGPPVGGETSPPPPPSAPSPDAAAAAPAAIEPPPVAAAPPAPAPRREPAPLAAGRLDVHSDSPVEIEIDGRPFGTAPVVGVRLARGEHRVIARYADGGAGLKTIYLGDEDVSVTFR
jgi:hypothetical protein